MKSAEELKLDEIMHNYHREKQIEHKIIDLEGNNLPRIIKKPPEWRLRQ